MAKEKDIIEDYLKHYLPNDWNWEGKSYMLQTIIHENNIYYSCRLMNNLYGFDKTITEKAYLVFFQIIDEKLEIAVTKKIKASTGEQDEKKVEEEYTEEVNNYLETQITDQEKVLN